MKIEFLIARRIPVARSLSQTTHTIELLTKFPYIPVVDEKEKYVFPNVGYDFPRN